MINQKMIKKVLVMISMMILIGGTFIAIMTYINIGFTDGFFSKWFKSLIFSIVVMMPLGGAVMYIADSFVKFSFPNQQEYVHNILIGLIMALFMEAIMAVSTTIGLSDLGSFYGTWLKSYLTALPFALVLSPIMTILVKPKLDAYLAK